MKQGVRDCRKHKSFEDLTADSNEGKHCGEPGKLEFEEVVVYTYLYEHFATCLEERRLISHHNPDDHFNMAQHRQKENETSTALFSKLAIVNDRQQSKDCTNRKLPSDHDREQVLYGSALA